MSVEKLRPSQVEKQANYIEKFQNHCDKWFSPKIDVRGKRVMVLGSGWGTEALWAATAGANEVVGLDPAPRERAPLELVLERKNASHLSKRISLLQHTSFDAPDIGAFDYIISNNVIEHIKDLAGTFESLRRFMPKKRKARIAAFTAPLYYSSGGAHLPMRQWDHLTLPPDELKSKVSDFRWKLYQDTLNRMTVTDMLGAVREAGLIMLDMNILVDRNISVFNEIAPHLPQGVKPMDLCLEGLMLKLAFPENL